MLTTKTVKHVFYSRNLKCVFRRTCYHKNRQKQSEIDRKVFDVKAKKSNIVLCKAMKKNVLQRIVCSFIRQKSELLSYLEISQFLQKFIELNYKSQLYYCYKSSGLVLLISFVISEFSDVLLSSFMTAFHFQRQINPLNHSNS